MKKWKIGVVGTGWWSDKHLGAWTADPRAELAALCNRSRPKMEARAEEFGLSPSCLYNSLDDMLDQADIDVVDIVTGPETHLDFVRKAAAAGKHILCQKPFARSLAEAEAIAEAAESAGVRLMVTENWRWLMPFRLLREQLEAGRIGRITGARYAHSDWYTPRMTPDAKLPQPFFRDMPQLLFYEMGTHWFDTWRALFGMPKRLYAETTRTSPYIAGEDGGIVTLGYDDWFGTMDMSWATRRHLDTVPNDPIWPLNHETFVIEGTEGTLRYFADGRIELVSKDGTTRTTLAEQTMLDHPTSHVLLSRHFLDCMETGASFATSARDNIETLCLVFATYESAANHDVIRFD